MPVKVPLLTIFCLFAAACGGFHVAEEAPTTNVLNPSIYFRPVVKAQTDSCPGEKKQAVKGAQGETLVNLCESDYKNCLMEGTCLLVSDEHKQSLDYSSSHDGMSIFKLSDLSRCPSGLGVQKICLDPYYSVAADLAIYKPGDVIFVPRLRGVKLPDGTTHDGYLVVRDQGALIKGAGRFDFYTGDESPSSLHNPFTALGLDDKYHAFEFQRVDEITSEKVRERRGYPNLPK